MLAVGFIGRHRLLRQHRVKGAGSVATANRACARGRPPPTSTACGRAQTKDADVTVRTERVEVLHKNSICTHSLRWFCFSRQPKPSQGLGGRACGCSSHSRLLKRQRTTNSLHAATAANPGGRPRGGTENASPDPQPPRKPPSAVGNLPTGDPNTKGIPSTDTSNRQSLLTNISVMLN